MAITYKFRADAAYFKAVIDRYYQQQPLLLRLPVQFGIAGLIIAGLLAYPMDPDSSKEALLLPASAGAFVVIGGVVTTKLGIFWRLKRKAGFGEDVELVVCDEGVRANALHTQGTWQWGAYPRSVRFPDGILLMRNGVIRWLPDSAILGGTANEATALVASKSNLRRIT